MCDHITIVFYSLQNVGSLGVQPSPINSGVEMAMAESEAQQIFITTVGNLRIVVFIGGGITDNEMYRQVNGIKQIAIGPILPEIPFARSRYSEIDSKSFIDGKPADKVQ